MSWRVARSLDVLLGEINAAAPTRSTVSDGSIGDAAHATRSSDHNPWVVLAGQGIVRARDFTHDPDGGLDCHRLAVALAALVAVGGHPACRSGAYVIWQRRIFSFDRRGEGWRPYTLSNPHEAHLHLSVATDPAGFDSTRPWFVMTEEPDMTDEERQILRKIAKDVAAIKDHENTRDKAEHERAKRRHEKVMAGLDTLAESVADLTTKRQVRKLREDLAADAPIAP